MWVVFRGPGFARRGAVNAAAVVVEVVMGGRRDGGGSTPM